MRTLKTILAKSPAALAILCALAFCSCSKNTISPTEAKDHIGKDETVCGTVYQVQLSKSGTVFLNIGSDHPNQPFTAVCFHGAIPYETLKQFESLSVCVTGTIRDYKGKPEITITSLSQITTQTGK
jgi:hypothetical protein